MALYCSNNRQVHRAPVVRKTGNLATPKKELGTPTSRGSPASLFCFCLLLLTVAGRSNPSLGFRHGRRNKIIAITAPIADMERSWPEVHQFYVNMRTGTALSLHLTEL